MLVQINPQLYSHPEEDLFQNPIRSVCNVVQLYRKIHGVLNKRNAEFDKHKHMGMPQTD